MTEPNTKPGSLTQGEREVFEFIVSFQKERGCSPTYRQIAANLRIGSTRTVHVRMKSLESRGAFQLNYKSIEINPAFLMENFGKAVTA